MQPTRFAPRCLVAATLITSLAACSELPPPVERAGASALQVTSPLGPGWGPQRAPSGVCLHQLRRHDGGRVLPHPRIRAVLWGSYWSVGDGKTAGSQLLNELERLSAAPAFYTRLSEYGIAPGSAGDSLYLPNAPAGALGDARIEAALDGQLGLPSADDLFIVFLPPTTTSTHDTDNPDGRAGGHHGNMTYDYFGIFPPSQFGLDVVYAVVENATVHEMVLVATHELSEAMTNPDASTGPQTWYEDGLAHAEVADLCEGMTNKIAGIDVDAMFSQTACRCVRERPLDTFDTRGNGWPSPTVIRNGTDWWSAYEGAVWRFGAPTDQAAGGDYDGDGRSEYTRFDAAGHQWKIFHPDRAEFDTVSFGQAGDLAVPADYDGDGKTDVAVFRPGDGTWHILRSSTGAELVVSFGMPGDLPVVADYDNDGAADIAVWRPSTAQWHVRPSSTLATYVVDHGADEFDTPVPGDYDGDGQADFAVFRRAEGKFYVWYSTATTPMVYSWGWWEDVPTGQDFDLDWKSDITVWDHTTGTWYIRESHDGSGFPYAWGQDGDFAVMGVQDDRF